MWWPCTCCPPASEWITTMIVCQQPCFISGSPHVVSLILNLDDHMYILYVCTIYNMYIHTYIWCIYIYIYIHRFTQQTFFSPLALKKPTFHSWLVGHIFHHRANDDILPGDDLLPGVVARPRWRWSWGDLCGIDADGTAVVAPSLFDPGRPGVLVVKLCASFCWKTGHVFQDFGETCSRNMMIFIETSFGY